MLSALNEERWPALGKIHGDFQSTRLKNTAVELANQDESMRYALVEACKRYGLVVAGYSGRDSSVMSALEEAIANGRGYPQGIFWFHRSGTEVLPSVEKLLGQAADSGIEAHLVEVETFDELLDSTLTQISEIPQSALNELRQSRPRITDAPVPRPGGHWPTIRLNAFPIVEMPTLCRRVVCSIGGQRQVQERLSQYNHSKEKGSDVIAVRRREAVLAFGSDTAVRGAFEPYDIKDFDLHSLDVGRLRFESAELGLLYEAFTKAIERQRPIRVQRRRNEHLLIIDQKRSQDDSLRKLRAATGKLNGYLVGNSLSWAEAARIHLEFRFDNLWVIIEPTVWISRSNDLEAQEIAKEFVRERLASRYNRDWSNIFQGWADAIIGCEQEVVLRAFGTSEGVDAVFRILKKTGFSKRSD